MSRLIILFLALVGFTALDRQEANAAARIIVVPSYAPYWEQYERREPAIDDRMARQRQREVMRQRAKNRAASTPTEAPRMRKTAKAMPKSKVIKEAKASPRPQTTARAKLKAPSKPLLLSSRTKKIGCEAAMASLQDYAFSVVIAKNCRSDQFIFEALRDDQRYEVKVSSTSGELTAVKKLKAPDEQAALMP